MNKIFITTTTFGQLSDEPIKLLESQEYEIVFNKLGRKLTEEETADSISEYDAILAGTEVYNKAILNRAKCLKVISRLGVGLDNIDLEFTEEKGIKVFATQTTPALAVAELALGLMLDLSRRISFQNQQLKSRVWKKNMGLLIHGKTLGIIGLGNCGKKLVALTKGLKLNYLACDLNQDDKFAKENDIRYCDLNYLLKNADIVSIHLSLTNNNRDLINYDRLKKMKQSALLINTSRGEVLNEVDLEKAIGEKAIAGAGLDVFKEEPYNGPLIKYDNVIITPHIGSYAREIRMTMELEATRNLIKGLEE